MIDYVQAQDDYLSVQSGGRAYLKDQTLSDLEATLDPKRFVRIHRSYLLNVERLVRVEQTPRESHIAVLKDGTTLPVSRTGYRRIQQLLGL